MTDNNTLSGALREMAYPDMANTLRRIAAERTRKLDTPAIESLLEAANMLVKLGHACDAALAAQPEVGGFSVVECANCEAQYDAVNVGCPECRMGEAAAPTPAAVGQGAKVMEALLAKLYEVSEKHGERSTDYDVCREVRDAVSYIQQNPDKAPAGQGEVVAMYVHECLDCPTSVESTCAGSPLCLRCGAQMVPDPSAKPYTHPAAVREVDDAGLSTEGESK